MSQTKLEQIKEFNEKAALKAKELEDTRDFPKADATNTQQVKDRAEQPPKTKEELEAERIQQEEQQRDTLHQLTEATSTLIQRINQPVDTAKNWISALPTPGGIAAMLIALAVFALFVIPVNAQGKTRGQLFFQSLLGRTHMLYRETNTVGGSVVHGASGDFGPTTGHGGPYSEPSTAFVDLQNLDIFGFKS